MTKLLEKFSKRLSLVGAYIASTLIIALVVLILIEIVGRSFFDYSTMLADEYSGYFYLAAVFFGLSYTFEQEGHIRINILTSRFSKKNISYFDIFAGILATAILSYSLYYSWNFMVDSKKMEMLSENVSETPLYLTQIPMVIGLFMFALAALVFTLKRIFRDS